MQTQRSIVQTAEQQNHPSNFRIADDTVRNPICAYSFKVSGGTT
jgi:hypothetical protein